MHFLKMHGLGNDFVVLDGRAQPVRLDRDAILAIADRRTGVGFDQMIVLEPSRGDGGLCFMRILNADASEVDACGNATRCVGRLLLAEHEAQSVTIETNAGLLIAEADQGSRVRVDMGPARLDWDQIPVAHEVDTLHLPVQWNELTDPVGVGMGNPHAVFFVPNAEAIKLEDLGPVIEIHPFFPEKVNVSVASLKADGSLRLRVWERGVGITRACGTAACATAVAAHRRGLTGRSATVHLDGGALDLTWREKDGHVIMAGDTGLSFEGELSADLVTQGSAP
ncbi:MAG: diaminopimelate epimerase [Magnetovibrionaceae bacterium]